MVISVWSGVGVWLTDSSQKQKFRRRPVTFTVVTGNQNLPTKLIGDGIKDLIYLFEPPLVRKNL